MIKGKISGKLNLIPSKTMKVIFLIIAIILIVMAVLAFFITAYFEGPAESVNELTTYKADIIIFNIILIPVGLIILNNVRKINKNINSIVIIPLIFLIVLGIQLIWVINVKAIPRADQAMELSLGINFNDKELMATLAEPKNYLGQYPFQVGFAKYINIIFNIVNSTSPMTFQILNVIYSTISLLLIYLITRKLFNNETANKIVLLLILGFSVYFMFFDVHVYGNIIGLMFALLAFYNTISYLEKKKIYKLFVIGISIMLSIILKSNYNIFLCGIIATILFEIIKNKKIRDIVAVGVILVVYIFGKNLCMSYIEKSENIELYSGIPMISYLYMGMAEQTTRASGWYTSDTVNIYNESNQDTAIAAEKSKELIKSRLNYFVHNPIYTIKYYSDKLASTWFNPTFQTIWCSKPGEVVFEEHPEYVEYFESKKIVKSMLGGNLYSAEEIYFNSYQVIIYGFAAYGIIRIYKKGDSKYILLPITFFGGFIFHILWETKAIYVIQYYLLLLPYAAYGITKFFNNMEEGQYKKCFTTILKKHKDKSHIKEKKSGEK